MIQKKYAYKGMDVHYYIDGNKENVPLILLHPTFADHNIFADQMAFFKKDYFVIVFDMIGHGQSQLGSSKASIADMVEVVHEVMKELDIPRAHLLGVSLGSLIAQSIADIYGSSILSVTMVGGYSIHKGYESILKKQNKEMLKWIFYLVFSMKSFRRYILNQSVSTDYGKALFRKGLDLFKRKAFAGMQGLNRLFVKRADPVNYPLLIVCGAQDNPVIKEASTSLEAVEPTGNYVEVPDAGHCANADNSRYFNETLESFLVSIQTSS